MARFPVVGLLCIAVVSGIGCNKSGLPAGGDAPAIVSVSGNGSAGRLHSGVVVTGSKLSGATVELISGNDTTALTTDLSESRQLLILRLRAMLARRGLERPHILHLTVGAYSPARAASGSRA